MANVKKETLKMDLAKLQAMQEPLTVRVERLQGSQRQSVGIPGKGVGSAPGTGWDRENVMGLAEWVVREWTGGGAYRFQVVDATGITMEWEEVFDPRTFPQKVSPEMAMSMAATPLTSLGQAPIVLPTGQLGGGGLPIPQLAQPLGSGGGSWPPSAAQMGYFPPGPAPVPQSATAPQLQPHYGAWAPQQPSWASPPQQLQPWGGYGGFHAATPLPAASAGPSAREQALLDELRRTQEEGRRRDDEARRRDEDRAREAQLNNRFSAIEQLIAKVTDVISRPAAPAVVADPAVAELRMKLEEERRAREQLEAKAERDRDRAEADRRAERAAAEFKELSAKMDARMTEAANTRPDPMIAMLQENSRAHAETMREMARSSKESTDRIASMMLPPQAMVTLMKDSSAGADALLGNVMTAMRGVFDTFQNMVKQQFEMNQGGQESPIPVLVGQGIQKISDMTEKYFGYKRDQAVSEATTQQTLLQAQAYTTAHAQAPQQQQPVQAPQPEQLQQQQPARPVHLQGVPAGGAPAAANGTVPKANGAKPGPINTDGGLQSRDGQTVARVVPLHRGPTDEQLFTVALGEINKLRRGVQTFLDNIRKEKPTLNKDGQSIGLSPPMAMAALFQGVERAAELGVLEQIPAFSMFMGEQFADLMDVLFRTAPQPYRDECVQILTKIAADQRAEQRAAAHPTVTVPAMPTVEEGGEAEEEEEDDNNDDEDGEDAHA